MPHTHTCKSNNLFAREPHPNMAIQPSPTTAVPDQPTTIAQDEGPTTGSEQTEKATPAKDQPDESATSSRQTPPSQAATPTKTPQAQPVHPPDHVDPALIHNILCLPLPRTLPQGRRRLPHRLRYYQLNPQKTNNQPAASSSDEIERLGRQITDLFLGRGGNLKEMAINLVNAQGNKDTVATR